jgi:predicted PurR-regulated permease PerM
VIAVALVPVLEWFERRRVPSTLAALTCVILFLAAANLAIAAILLPAVEWFTLLPERIGRVKTALAPVLDLYTNLERFIDRTLSSSGRRRGRRRARCGWRCPTVRWTLSRPPRPTAAIQAFFALLVIFFFLSGWTRMRKHAIVGRASFTGAMTTARVISQVVTATSTYLGTITVINLALGLLTAAVVYAIGMPTPLMWGGIVAVLNYVPYLGPIAAAVLLGLGGLMTFADPGRRCCRRRRSPRCT